MAWARKPSRSPRDPRPWMRQHPRQIAGLGCCPISLPTHERDAEMLAYSVTAALMVEVCVRDDMSFDRHPGKSGEQSPPCELGPGVHKDVLQHIHVDGIQRLPRQS